MHKPVPHLRSVHYKYQLCQGWESLLICPGSCDFISDYSPVQGTSPSGMNPQTLRGFRRVSTGAHEPVLASQPGRNPALFIWVEEHREREGQRSWEPVATLKNQDGLPKSLMVYLINRNTKLSAKRPFLLLRRDTKPMICSCVGLPFLCLLNFCSDFTSFYLILILS